MKFPLFMAHSKKTQCPDWVHRLASSSVRLLLKTPVSSGWMVERFYCDLHEISAASSMLHKTSTCHSSIQKNLQMFVSLPPSEVKSKSTLTRPILLRPTFNKRSESVRLSEVTLHDGPSPRLYHYPVWSSHLPLLECSHWNGASVGVFGGGGGWRGGSVHFTLVLLRGTASLWRHGVCPQCRFQVLHFYELCLCGSFKADTERVSLCMNALKEGGWGWGGGGGGSREGFRWKRWVPAITFAARCIFPVCALHQFYVLPVFERLYKYAEQPDDMILRKCTARGSIESIGYEDKFWWLS